MKKNSTAAIIAIYLCTTLTYVCDMPSVILALMNQDFPGQEAAVTLILTLPSIVGMVTSFAMTPCLLRFSRKVLALLSVASAFASGMVFLISGSHSIGILLSGVFCRANDSDTIFVICHGLMGNKNTSDRVKLAWELARNGLNSFRFDFRSFGESEG